MHYRQPEMEVIRFEIVDIVTGSLTDGGVGDEDSGFVGGNVDAPEADWDMN